MLTLNSLCYGFRRSNILFYEEIIKVSVKWVNTVDRLYCYFLFFGITDVSGPCSAPTGNQRQLNPILQKTEAWPNILFHRVCSTCSRENFRFLLNCVPFKSLPHISLSTNLADVTISFYPLCILMYEGNGRCLYGRALSVWRRLPLPSLIRSVILLSVFKPV